MDVLDGQDEQTWSQSKDTPIARNIIELMTHQIGEKIKVVAKGWG